MTIEEQKELKDKVERLESVVVKLLETLNHNTDWWGYSDMLKELKR